MKTTVTIALGFTAFCVLANLGELAARSWAGVAAFFGLLAVLFVEILIVTLGWVCDD